MNGDRPLGQFSGSSPQQNNVADALLLEQLIRQQELRRQQESVLRSHILGSGTPLAPVSRNSGSGGSGLDTSSFFNLPSLPRSDASIAAATLRRINRDDDTLLVARLLSQQQVTLGGQEEKTTSRYTIQGQRNLLGEQSALPSLALAAALHTDRILPEPQRIQMGGETFGNNDKEISMSAPPAKRKKGPDLDSAIMPAPPKRSNFSQLPSYFPLPNKDAAPQPTTPKLISFQRTWGKLEKCKMRAELFRRRLERGQIQLTGVSRSVLHQARQRDGQNDKQTNK